MCKICTECTIPGIPSSSAACAHVIAGWKTIRTHLQLHHVMHVTKSPELGLVRLIICALSLARLRGWPLAPRSASPFRLAAAPGSSTRRHRSAPGSARLVRSCRRAGHLRSQHGPRRMRRILTARRIPVRGWCACAGAIVSACLPYVVCIAGSQALQAEDSKRSGLSERPWYKLYEQHLYEGIFPRRGFRARLDGSLHLQVSFVLVSFKPTPASIVIFHECALSRSHTRYS